jgi:O-antigen chain-terminating methyltransferase
MQQANSRQREQIEQTAKSLKRDVDRVFQKQQQVSTELVFQGQRLSTLLEEARRRLPAPFDDEQLRMFAQEQDHRLDAFYASFDEQFRGSRDEIKERLKVYLPLIKQRGIGSEAMPLVDVGCGRGEWLELLKEQQLDAVGVDSNRVLVSECLKRNLKVIEEDLIGYLRRLPDASLGAVSGFHIIEHLPLETLVELLDQTIRVLKSGGGVIFETPNPQNVLVGSCNFYFDPTHRNPLPSQVMRFLLESRGFAQVEVMNLNPSDDTPVAGDSELARRFNRYFYGPMDYAVMGWKVGPDDRR